MTIRRRYLPLLLTAVAVTSAAEQSDPAALVAAVEERVQLQDQVEGRFEQEKHIDVLPEPLESHGRFSYDAGEGLVWETLAPVANRLEFNESGIRQSMEGETVWQVDGSKPAVETITRVLASVLSTDWQALQRHFHISGEVDEGGWTLSLEARDDMLREVMARIRLRGDRQLSSMTLVENNGDRSEIDIQLADS